MADYDEEPTDYELHAALADAIARGAVSVEVDFPKINRNDVPGFRTTDFIVPPLVVVVLSAYTTLQFGIPWGIALFAAGIAAFFLFVRPRARIATIDRVRRLAMTHLEAWNAVWKNGGYRLTLTTDPAMVAGPGDDWREFARRHVLTRNG